MITKLTVVLAAYWLSSLLEVLGGFYFLPLQSGYFIPIPLN